MPLSNINIRCTLCGSDMSYINVSSHILGKKHCSKLKLVPANLYSTDMCALLCIAESEKLEDKNITKILNYCPVVQNLVYPKIYMRYAITGNYDLVMHSVQVVSPTISYCLVCNASLFDQNAHDTHFSGKKHANRIQLKEVSFIIDVAFSLFETFPTNICINADEVSTFNEV